MGEHDQGGGGESVGTRERHRLGFGLRSAADTMGLRSLGQADLESTQGWVQNGLNTSVFR